MNLPDVEALVSAHLRTDPRITALVANRVYTDIPANATFPLIRLWRIGGSPRFNRPLHLDAALLQIDAFGGPKATAQNIAQTTRAVLADSLPGTHALGVVTGVDFGPMSYRPDETWDPAKPRYLFTTTVYIHP